MTRPPIILVPGFWLGAWAWDEVAALLRADGHEVTALTLPGMGSVAEDRSRIHLVDHVDAIVAAVEAAGRPVVLAVHSAAGFTGYAASDRVPGRIAAMVYVDTAPGKPPLDPSFDGNEKPLPSLDELRGEENLADLTEDQLATFVARAVPVPGALLRDGYEFANEARRDIPSTIIATGYSAEAYRASVANGWSFLAGIPELRNLDWVDLPTSHWPMWSRPTELAAIIGRIATAADRTAPTG
jgi:pimeloyl-ACP methyl ester carboxylesterase